MRVSGRHPQFQRQGVNETPCAIKFSQTFLFSGYSPGCFFGRDSEETTQKSRTAFGNIAESGQVMTAHL